MPEIHDAGEKHVSKNDLEQLLEKYEVWHVRNTFIERLMTVSIAGIGIIAALAWDDAFKAIAGTLFQDTSTITAKLTYAVFLTLLATVISLILRNQLKKLKKPRA
jgi:hypothetical protein